MSKAESKAGDSGPFVMEENIQYIMVNWTRILIEKVSSDESDHLLKMEETHHKLVIGQDEVVKTIKSRHPSCPRWSEESMVLLNMSELMERPTVLNLIGSPQVYVGCTEGGHLSEVLHRQPYILVLFDEIKKAHSDIFNMMLQILKDGMLPDSKDRIVDFKNTLLNMTSNVGSSKKKKGGRRNSFNHDYNEMGLSSDEYTSKFESRAESMV